MRRTPEEDMLAVLEAVRAEVDSGCYGLMVEADEVVQLEMLEKRARLIDSGVDSRDPSTFPILTSCSLKHS